jgi:G3E family GTPase
MVAFLVESNQMSLAYERRLFESSAAKKPAIPCTLITGFLGSGKTTLVRHILASKADLRVAVLVNEFGQSDIDGALVNINQTNASLGLPQQHALSHGCACCDISKEFQAAVTSMVDRRDDFDYLVVETSGLADPQPIANALAELGARLELVVAVVDAEALPAMLDIAVTRKQLAVADLVLINK